MEETSGSWYVLIPPSIFRRPRIVTDTSIYLQHLNKDGERSDGRCGGHIFNENGRVPQAEKTFGRYETILYAFYNKELSIDDTDMGTALEDCFLLVEIAEYLGCTMIVGKSIEVALLKHGQLFFKSIAAVPHRWVVLAHSIRSELIFRESMVHLVGNWKKVKASQSMTNALREVPRVRGMIEKYHCNLLARCKKLELKLTEYYPGDIEAPSKVRPILREEYSKNVLVYLALTFFRHWLNNRLVCDQGRHAPDCGYKLYRQIYAGGEEYMDKNLMNNFNHRWPMTKKGFGVIENHLSEIKEVMSKNVVESRLLESTCQLDIRKFPVPYFTCSEFKSEDFPWLKEDAAARAVAPKRVYKAGGNEIARQNLEKARRAQERGQIVGDGMEDEFEVDIEDDFEESPSKRARAG